MSNNIRIFIIASFITFSSPFELTDDNVNSAIILHQNGELSLFKNEQIINYASDISILSKMGEVRTHVKEYCLSEKRSLKTFNTQLNTIQTMKNLNKKEVDEFDNLMTNKYIHINNLEENFNKFERANETDRCRIFRSMVGDVNRIYTEFNNLSRREFTTLGEILSLFNLKRDVMFLARNFNETNFTFPFDFSEHFLNDFLSSTQFSIKFDESTVFLSFKIPTYQNFELFEVYPKPYTYNYTTYFLKSNIHYAVFNKSESILFNDIMLDKFCFTFKFKKYCTKPSHQNDCDREYINSKAVTDVKVQCFKWFPNQNSATQIFSTIYFHILYPISVFIDCGGYINPVCIFKSSKINLKNCSIKTPFFDFNYEFEVVPYKLYTATHSGEEYGFWLREYIRHGQYIAPDSKINKTYTILLFIVIISIFLFLMGVYFKYKDRLREGNLISFYVSAQDTFSTEPREAHII